jgi:biofilm protein TabA
LLNLKSIFNILFNIDKMKYIIIAMLLMGLNGLYGCRSVTDPTEWSKEKLDRWFNTSEWQNGWNVKPDSSINKRDLAIAYFKNKDRWEKAFMFFKDNDLESLDLKRYDIDGDSLFAIVSEYRTKDPDTAEFEAHRKYIDIQYVISGKEIINIAPISTVKKILSPYNAEKDIEFVTVEKETDHLATPDKFFIFFPGDAHRPGIKDEANSNVRKIVLKVWID